MISLYGMAGSESDREPLQEKVTSISSEDAGAIYAKHEIQSRE